jgi:hypothetical protein
MLPMEKFGMKVGKSFQIKNVGFHHHWSFLTALGPEGHIGKVGSKLELERASQL